MRRFVAVLCAVAAIAGLTTFLHAFLPGVPTGTWVSTASMEQPRSGATAVPMPDGRVLIAGGTAAGGTPLATAEIFNTDGTFSTVAPMHIPRSGHAAVWLLDGYVMVAGGRTTGGGLTNTAELFDPLTDEWRLLSGTMQEPRAGLTATQLPDGNILLAGGDGQTGPVAALESFSLAGEEFSFAGSLLSARKAHVAAALADGRVLMAGGTDANGNTLSSTELYDPQTETVMAGPSLGTPRAAATATTMADGRVLIAGGSCPERAQNNISELRTAEVFDPSAGTMTPVTAAMAYPRAGQQAFLLPNNNNVLLVGGTFAGYDVPYAELFTPWTGQFTATGQMSVPRFGATGTPLNFVDGLLLVAGGGNEKSAELYGFATLKTNQHEYSPGQAVVITGSGWQAGESVALRLTQVETGAQKGLSAVADSLGMISNSDYTPQSADLGTHYILTAIGGTSQAQVLFKDATSMTSIVAGNQTPSPVIAGNSATYAITVNRQRNGGINATLSATGLPAGATASFNPATVAWTGGDQTAKTSTLTISTTGATPAGTFGLTISASDPAVNTVTTTANLVVSTTNTAPAITQQPASATVVYGASASFTAAASGNPIPTVQWQLSTDSGANWNNVSGATTPTLTISVPTVSYSGYQYRAVFTNLAGSVASSSATLTVNAATATVTLGSLNQTYDGTAKPVTVTTSPGGLSASVTYNGTANLPTNAGSYAVVATVTDPNYTGSATGELIVAKSTATITLASLSATYDGSEKLATVTTNPAGLSTSVTYNGSAAAPINAGSYAVVATVTDPNYAGSATDTFVINQAAPTITWVNPADLTYGTALSATQLNATASVPGAFAYTPAAGTVLNAGPAQTLSVTFSPTDTTNYTSANKTVTINVQTAAGTVTLGNLMSAYDGTPKPVAITTNPAGLSTSVTYDGSPTPPTNAGNYAVVAQITDTNYTGSATGTLEIAKAGQVITVTNHAPSQAADNSNFTVGAMASSGLPVTYGSSGSCTNSGATYTITSASGECAVIYSQAGDSNRNAAPSITEVVSATKITQTIAFAALSDKTYGDPPFAVNATASSGLPVNLAVTSGPCSISSGNVISIDAAGACTITATQAGDDTYAAASVERSFNIQPATPVISWSNPATITYGTQLSSTQLNATASFNGTAVSGTFNYSPAAGTALAAGSGQTLSVTFQPSNTNYSSVTASVKIDVTRSVITVTGPNISRGYGDINPSMAPAYSGFINGDTSEAISTAAVCVSDATPSSAITGDSNPAYAINCSGAVATNYSFKYLPGTLKVVPAPLTITPNDVSRTQGTPNPEFTGTIIGIRNADPITATYLTFADENSPAGKYPITVAAVSDGGTGRLSNYTVTNKGGVLTIVPVSETPAGMPNFSPAPGLYTTVQNVTLWTISSGATIYYTTDGSTPTTASTQYTGPIVISRSMTIKAITVGQGYATSPVATGNYTIAAAMPTFSPAPGTFTGSQAVVLWDASPGVTIYYTMDGSTPTTASRPYTGPIVASENTTIKAIAVGGNYDPSAVAAGVFSIAAATPTFSPAPATYGTPQTVTLSTTTAGGTIYYTMDGSTPTSASAAYTSPITVSKSATIKTIVVASNYASSAITSGTYTMVASKPTLSPAPSTYTTAQTVKLSTISPGAMIYYTVDGSTPTTASTPYTGPIAVSTSTTIKAIAAGSDYASSTMATGTYTIVASRPTFSPAPSTYAGSQTVTLSTITPGATIYYTTDGSTPSVASTPYTGPITVSATTTIKAMAAAPNYGSSTISSGMYTIK